MLSNKILLQNFLSSFRKTKFGKFDFWKNKFLEKRFLSLEKEFLTKYSSNLFGVDL